MKDLLKQFDLYLESKIVGYKDKDTPIRSAPVLKPNNLHPIAKLAKEIGIDASKLVPGTQTHILNGSLKITNKDIAMRTVIKGIEY